VSEDKSARLAAVEKLRILGAKCAEAIELLLIASDDETWEVRAAAVVALGRFSNPEAIDALKNRLEDENPRVREWAQLSLERIERSTSDYP
jgi:HEAT repeat protein